MLCWPLIRIDLAGVRPPGGPGWYGPTRAGRLPLECVMAKRKKQDRYTKDLLRQAASDEKRLLKRERRAEQALAEEQDGRAQEQARLQRVAARVGRLKNKVGAA